MRKIIFDGSLPKKYKGERVKINEFTSYLKITDLTTNEVKKYDENSFASGVISYNGLYNQQALSYVFNYFKPVKEYCQAKHSANRPDETYKDCDCVNFCKFDGIQFDSILS